MSSEEYRNLTKATLENVEKSDEEKVEEILKNSNISKGNTGSIDGEKSDNKSNKEKGKFSETDNREEKEKEEREEKEKEKDEEVGEVEIHKIPGKKDGERKKKPLRTVRENFEHDIITRYRTKLWRKFRKALQDFQLIEPGDKVAIALSGGKDSLLMAKLFEEVQKHGDFYFDIVYLSMDPGFSPPNKKILTDNCAKLGIDVKIEESDVFEVANKMSPDQPCFMCAKMRRGFLYRKAKEYGCNKLALGHHFDDVVETTLINIFYAGCYKTMVPKVNSENFEGLTLIRPMVYIREEDIRSIMRDNNITCMTCGCAVASNKLPSTRRNVKQLIKELKENYGIKEQNIFRSAVNVNLNGIYGYKDDQERFDYNDIYKRGKRQ
ncbi:adenine nucleotide alpha hydrolases-like protein [Neocallimastix lanati (nom. inval.)]|jgi:tRNA(Ile)-lysidine synthase TilS/MesJ|uniref:Adenine nucleotide alpha hydrolases-like protein n=1 Tax=Neocallimastix californiae TaxID=1754190 RepID=A0A1Y2D6T8_9FUNG|nr:adenine nucleotide alpha hydrolases-like protein [Neocallimastix sp. JGI-2020a]ORY54917.1 adenine nucleotide alpha hydrolases-like protein [Neocallimastix californiae]|eukprot:ORY54917.1 adenine nucleotide alpha hydrolases-like protein [Neocallimastix californiae]